jgi:hypothetical protein
LFFWKYNRFRHIKNPSLRTAGTRIGRKGGGQPLFNNAKSAASSPWVIVSNEDRVVVKRVLLGLFKKAFYLSSRNIFSLSAGQEVAILKIE